MRALWTQLQAWVLLSVTFGHGTRSGALLHSTHLRPDGFSYAVRDDRPVRFSFWPQADERGVTMQRFKIWVWQDEEMVAQKEVDSGIPELKLSLGPGRYRWFVQWWSTDAEGSEVANSALLVEPVGDAPWQGVPWLGNKEANEFRVEVALRPHTESAALTVEMRIATLGFGYVTINGQDVSKDRLSYSGFTNTEKRVLYRTYDVTSLFNASRAGVVLVGLGCGFRCDPKGRLPLYMDGADRSHDPVPKVFRMQLLQSGKLLLHSGSTQWQMRQGPAVEDSVYDGEIWDPAAATPWIPAVQLPTGVGPRGTMVPAAFPGVRETRVDHPVEISRPDEGIYVVDFGSNVAGVCELLNVPPAKISLRHGELMQHAALPTLKRADPKRVYFGNLRSATANDTLTTDRWLASWSPRLTYHGFRYVEVHGYPGSLTKEGIRRLRLNTAVEQRLHLQLEDEVLQAIHEGAIGSQRANLMQVPTDCPQRDERLAWMGDGSLAAVSMLEHFDYASMAEDWIDTMVDEMDSNGALPDTAPFQRYGNRPADPSWSAAFLELLWVLSVKGADLTAVQTHWGRVKAHVGNLKKQYRRAGSLKRIRETYGDWCPPPATKGGQDKEIASRGFPAAFSLVRAVRQAAELGKMLGGTAVTEAEAFAKWAADLTEEFHRVFYDSERHWYDTGTMLSFVLPLALDAVPDSEKKAVFGGLLAKIAKHGNTWTGGIINNRHLFDVLHNNGQKDLALEMLQRKEYPSYGYMFFNEHEPCRECMWELPDAPFQPDDMNSRNHHMYSPVGSYLVRIAGFVQGPGEAEFTAIVPPRRAAGRPSMRGAATSMHLRQGLANFSWWWEDATSVRIQLVVPVGMRAQLHIPYDLGLFDTNQGSASAAAELGAALVSLDGERFTRLSLASGRYETVTVCPAPALLQ